MHSVVFMKHQGARPKGHTGLHFAIFQGFYRHKIAILLPKNTMLLDDQRVFHSQGKMNTSAPGNIASSQANIPESIATTV